jgi:hypothetical protein
MKLGLLALALLIAGLLVSACHPTLKLWPSLKPSAPQSAYGREVSQSLCTFGQPIPSQGPEWLNPLNWWDNAIGPSGGMNPAFPNWGDICGGFNPNPIIYFSYDWNSNACGGGDSSPYACNDFSGFAEGQPFQGANIFYTPAWASLPAPERKSIMLRETGYLLNLGYHSHSQCYVDPLSGQRTIMGKLPSSGCTPLTWPQPADVFGIVCMGYDYNCSGSFGFSASSSPDSDGDGVSDAVDNCINQPNPDQLDRDVDGLGNVCDSDDDGDGHLDAKEAYMGTDWLDNCRDNSSHDAWPPDPDRNGSANVGDLVQLFGGGKMLIGDQHPLYKARSDMDANRQINVGDLVQAFAGGVILTSCPSKVKSQIVDVIEANEQFIDVTAAQSSGFDQGPQYIPNRGAFYYHPERWDFTHNIYEPDGLWYDGSRLVGLAYFVPLGQSFAGSFTGTEADVYTYDDLCVDSAGVASTGVSESECDGIWWDEEGQFKFLWFRHNPNGPFAETNPAVP